LCLYGQIGLFRPVGSGYIATSRTRNSGRVDLPHTQVWFSRQPAEKKPPDKRNFVKKAVDWALRQIGKRNARLYSVELELAGKTSKKESPSAKWVASDAIGELTSKAVQKRLRSSS
jgi:hypothetical protein